MELEAKIQQLKKIDTGQVINAAIKQIERTVIEMITHKQIFDRGEMPDGSKIRPLDRTYPVYSSMYEAYKSQLGKYQGHVDLSLTGEFLRSWSVTYFKDGIEIKAGNVQREGKNLTEELRWRYGDFEGLSETNLDKLRGMVRDAFQNRIRQIIES
jgi:hypothetical protein